MSSVEEENTVETNATEEKVIEQKPTIEKKAVEPDFKKINLGQAVTVPLALAARGVRIGSDNFEKFQVAEKLSSVTQHPLAVKVVEKVSVQKDALYFGLGLVLLFHGAQFQNLFLCAQVVVFFCKDRLKESVWSIKSDVVTALEKMVADAPLADNKAETKPDNQAAQKRNSKKNSAKGDTDLSKIQEDHAAVTKKALKALDSDKLARSAFDLFASFMACHMVMHFGSMQVVTVAHALVLAAKLRIDAIFDYAGLEDLAAWTDLIISFVLYIAFGFIAIFMGPLALAMNMGICGAHLVVENGIPLVQALRKSESAPWERTSLLSSFKGLALLGGLTAFGTIWQFWALLAGNGMHWIFTLLYMPAVVAEGFVGLL